MTAAFLPAEYASVSSLPGLSREARIELKALHSISQLTVHVKEIIDLRFEI
jgi:hypothetical protein